MARTLSIRAKLLGILVLTSCVALLVAGILIVGYDFVAFRRQKVNELATQAEMLGAVSSAALAFDDPRAAQEYLATLALRPNLRYAAIYDAGGNLFASYQHPDAGPFRAPSPEAEGHRVEGDDLLLFRPIRKGPAVLGIVHLRGGLDLIPRLKGYAAIVLSVMALSLLVAFLLSVWLQGLISQPLLEVARVARGVIDRQDYSPRVIRRSEDEVGMLVDAFNQMLAQVEGREAALRQANQALRRRTEDLARSNADLERFAHVASHDLQEPLRMVSSFTQLLARRYQGRLDAEADEYIHFAVTGAQTMQSLIRDLLAYSQAGSQGQERVPTPLSEVVERARMLLLVALREATLEVGELPTLDVDPGQLTQVFQNLLGNALKFRADRPLKIEIGAQCQPHSQGWTLWVRDNGIGLDPQYKERIFVIFQRLHTQDEYPGTGIGLAICKRILERHGGSIWVESSPGEGSTFFFTLPEPGEAPHA